MKNIISSLISFLSDKDNKIETDRYGTSHGLYDAFVNEQRSGR